MIDFGVCMDKLTSLENTDVLADFFRGEQIKGERTHPNKCPIAKWIQQSTGYENVVAVPETIFVWNGLPGFADRDTTATYDNQDRATSPVIKAFMKYFDQGDYPDLMEEAEEE